MTTPLELLAESDVDGDDAHGISRPVRNSVVETASQQTTDSLAAELDCGVDRLVALLGQAVDDEQLATELSDDRNANREQLAASLDRLAGEELSTADCERLSTTFVDALEQQLLSPPADVESAELTGETTLGRLGDTAFQNGALDVAETYYQLAIELAREHNDTPADAAGLRSLGNVALQNDQPEAAEAYHRKSLELSRDHNLQSIEADSLASLGTIEASRGYPETAETYLKESLDLKRLLGDRFGEATCLASLGNVAENREVYETAVDHYTEALELFTADEPRERLQTLQGLVDAERARGDEETAIEYCESGLDLLADAELSDGTELRRWFETTHATLTVDAEAIESLYASALDHVEADETQPAFELLEGIWECRTAFESSSDSYELCLRAGVGLAAYHLLVDSETSDPTAVTEEIKGNRKRLSEPAEVLFGFVTSGGTAVDGEISTENADPGGSLDERERVAYAEFLRLLTKTPPPSTLYATALEGIVQDSRNPRDVVGLCLSAWDQREEFGDSRGVVGAGLIAEAHRELFDIDLPLDRDSVFGAAETSRTLSPPLETLIDRLKTGVAGGAADSVADGADRTDPSLIDIEQLAVAKILDRLDG